MYTDDSRFEKHNWEEFAKLMFSKEDFSKLVYVL